MSKFQPGQSVSAIPGNYSGQREGASLLVQNIGGAYEVQTITCPAGSGVTQGDFVIITDFEGTETAVWLDLDADGTEPNGALYAATDAQIEVDVASADTDEEVATAFGAAIAALAGFTVAVDGAVVTITSTIKGDIDAAVPHDEPETGAGSLVVAEVTAGAEPDIGGKYFLCNSASTGYYVWFSSNGVGTDPEVADRTGAEVALTGNETESQIATAAAAVIDALSGLYAISNGPTIVISADASQNLTDVTAGDSGFALGPVVQGGGVVMSPSTSVTGLTSSPSSY